MAITDIAREEINASTAQKKATTTTREKTTTEKFLDTIEQRNGVTRDDKGAAYLGKYAISADMWETWAAAAGYPDARWDDPLVAQKVAAWAAQELYSEFGNWGLVAIGWRYGAGTARKFKEMYGGVPGGDLIQKAMGSAGARFIGMVIEKMGNVGAPPVPPMRLYPGSPGGNIELKFKVEEDETPEPEPRRMTGAQALQGVLSAMADRIAGGKRLSVEEAQTQIVPSDDETSIPTNISPEDTEHLNG